MKNLFYGLTVLSLICSTPVIAETGDELWEVTSKMEMEGMPFAMPAQKVKVCMKKNDMKNPNKAIPKNRDQKCQMTDVKSSGNKTTWTMKCEGEHPMTGRGEMTRGEGFYNGKTEMHMDQGDMKMSYEGKRIGSCKAK